MIIIQYKLKMIQFWNCFWFMNPNSFSILHNQDWWSVSEFCCVNSNYIFCKLLLICVWGINFSVDDDNSMLYWKNQQRSNSDEQPRGTSIRFASRFMFSTSKLILWIWTWITQSISATAHLSLLFQLKLTPPSAQTYSYALDPFEIWHHGYATESKGIIILEIYWHFI